MSIFDKFHWLFGQKEIQYVDGDATKPIGKGKKLIIHCCNDCGGWGSGFVLALSKLSYFPESCYRAWHRATEHPTATGTFKLGEVQFVPFNSCIDPNLHVANMIGQHNIGRDRDGNPPIRYDAIRQCLQKVCKYCKKNNISVHAPKFGSDLAGGKWEIIEKIIKDELTDKGVSVTVYEWKG